MLVGSRPKMLLVLKSYTTVTRVVVDLFETHTVMVIVNLFIYSFVLSQMRPSSLLYYNPDIIADEFKTYSVAL